MENKYIGRFTSRGTKILEGYEYRFREVVSGSVTNVFVEERSKLDLQFRFAGLLR